MDKTRQRNASERWLRPGRRADAPEALSCNRGDVVGEVARSTSTTLGRRTHSEAVGIWHIGVCARVGALATLTADRVLALRGIGRLPDVTGSLAA